MIRPKLGLVVIVSPLEVGAERASWIRGKAITNLSDLSIDLLPSHIVQDEKSARQTGEKFRKGGIDLICLIAGTWSEDHLVMDILEEADVPLITWALPGIHTGSLCGCHQICSILKELNKTYRFVYGDLDSQKVLKEIDIFSRAVAVKNRLRKVKLGLIGHRVKGMTEVAFDEFALKSIFGPRLIYYGIDRIKENANNLSDKEVNSLWQKVKRTVGEIKVKGENSLYSLKMYLAIKDFVKENNLSGVAIECYPHLMGEVCLAYSLLAEEGIVGACEGDINSALAMLMLYQLTGKPVHNTDLLAINKKDNTVVFSHCGAGGFSLAEKRSEITLSPVRLMDRGVCILFPAKPGPVTMLNIVGRKDTYRMAVLEGEAIPTEMVFPGNPIKIKLPLPADRLIYRIAENGIGHHWMIGYGKVEKELKEYAELIKVKRIDWKE